MGGTKCSTGSTAAGSSSTLCVRCSCACARRYNHVCGLHPEVKQCALIINLSEAFLLPRLCPFTGAFTTCISPLHFLVPYLG